METLASWGGEGVRAVRSPSQSPALAQRSLVCAVGPSSLWRSVGTANSTHGQYIPPHCMSTHISPFNGAMCYIYIYMYTHVQAGFCVNGPKLFHCFCVCLRGSAEFHHLGHGEEEHVRTPQQVSGLSEEEVVEVAVGSQHCLALTARGEVYGWGKNSTGEVDASRDAVALPTLIPGASKLGVVYVACGMHEVGIHTLSDTSNVGECCLSLSAELCLLQTASGTPRDPSAVLSRRLHGHL